MEHTFLHVFKCFSQKHATEWTQWASLPCLRQLIIHLSGWEHFSLNYLPRHLTIIWKKKKSNLHFQACSIFWWKRSRNVCYCCYLPWVSGHSRDRWPHSCELLLVLDPKAAQWTTLWPFPPSPSWEELDLKLHITHHRLRCNYSSYML